MIYILMVTLTFGAGVATVVTETRFETEGQCQAAGKAVTVRATVPEGFLTNVTGKCVGQRVA